MSQFFRDEAEIFRILNDYLSAPFLAPLAAPFLSPLFAHVALTPLAAPESEMNRSGALASTPVPFGNVSGSGSISNSREPSSVWAMPISGGAHASQGSNPAGFAQKRGSRTKRFVSLSCDFGSGSKGFASAPGYREPKLCRGLLSHVGDANRF